MHLQISQVCITDLLNYSYYARKVSLSLREPDVKLKLLDLHAPKDGDVAWHQEPPGQGGVSVTLKLELQPTSGDELDPNHARHQTPGAELLYNICLCTDL